MNTEEQQEFIRICVKHIQKTSRRHMEQNLPCEDVFFKRIQSHFSFYGLADGQTGKPHCIRGAQASLTALANYLQAFGIERAIAQPFPDELPCRIVQQIRMRLLSLASQWGGEFSDYSSTLLAVAIDPVTGQYILAHLGDGIAIHVTEDGSVTVRSAPEGSFLHHQTWLTTSMQAVPHLRLSAGQLRPGQRLILLSDGAESLCLGKNILPEAKELMKSGSQSDLFDYFNAASPKDDATCIVLDIQSPGRTKPPAIS